MPQFMLHAVSPATLLQNDTLLNNLQVGILLEKDRNVVWANRYLLELLGFASGDVIDHPSRIFFQNDADYASTEFADHKTIVRELALRHKNGHAVWCRMAGNPVAEDDHSQGVTWSFSCISAPTQSGQVTRQMYEALAQTSSRQEALLRNVQVALLLVKDRKVVWGNQYFFDMLGYTPEELIGQSARYYFHNEEDFIRIGQEGYPLLMAGKPYASELLLRGSGDNLKWCLITGNAVDLDNPEDGYIWSFVDITDRVQAETREKEAETREKEAVEREQLEAEKMAALGVVIAGVAHEINTPIGVGYTLVTHFKTKTKEFTDLFSGGAMKRSDLQSYVELSSEMATQLAANISRAAELIQSFKQIAVDQSRDDQREFNLNEYLQEIVMSLLPTLRKTPHKIEVDCPDDIEMYSYPGSLSQVVTNLVMNALIHAYDTDRSGTMRVVVRQAGDQVQMNFHDDGKGIPPEHLSKIFDPFFTTKRSAGGSGLGLNIVFNMVTRKLQGRVTCSSVEGEGTVFKMEMPLVIDVNAEKPKETSDDNMMESYKKTINKNPPL